MENIKEILAKGNPINIVLSGGGAKTVGHLAVLELLEQHQIPIHSISGSSAGAIIAAMYASGRKTQEIMEFFKSTSLFRYTWMNPLKRWSF